MNNFLNYLDKRLGNYVNVECLHHYPRFLLNNILDITRGRRSLKRPARNIIREHKVVMTSDPEIWYDRLFVDVYLYDFTKVGIDCCFEVSIEGVHDDKLSLIFDSIEDAVRTYKSIPSVVSYYKLVNEMEFFLC